MEGDGVGRLAVVQALLSRGGAG